MSQVRRSSSLPVHHNNLNKGNRVEEGKKRGKYAPSSKHVVHHRIVVRSEELGDELEAVLPITTLTLASALPGIHGDIRGRQNLQEDGWVSSRCFLSP